MCGIPTKGLSQELSAFLINDTSRVQSGGLEQGTVSRSLFAADIKYELSEYYTVFAQVQAQRGSNGSDLVGDIQAFSNIDEDNFTALYEVWLEGTFADTGLRFKLGQVDANSEFAYADHAAEFINSSMGFSPSVSYLPTYPDPRISLNLFYDGLTNSRLGFGIYADENNKFDEQFYIAEWQSSINQVSFKIGFWQQTGSVERLDEQNDFKNGANGYYALGEGALPFTLLSAESVAWYSQLGMSSSKTSEIDRHLGAGIVLYNVFSLPGHSAGFGVTHIRTSEFLHQPAQQTMAGLLDAGFQKQETAFELFYKYEVNQYLSVKPDSQVITSPAANKVASDAVVLTLRTELSF